MGDTRADPRGRTAADIRVLSLSLSSCIVLPLPSLRRVTISLSPSLSRAHPYSSHLSCPKVVIVATISSVRPPSRAARRVHEYISLDCVKSLITLARTAPPRPWAQRFCSRACRGRQLRHVIHCLRVLARIQYIPVSLREVAHSRQSAEVGTNLIDSPE